MIQCHGAAFCTGGIAGDCGFKALYLDCDTMSAVPLKKMYRTHLGGCLAGMIMEPTVYKEMKESIHMEKDDAYFNSGVILMNLAGWRRENVLKKLLDFYGDHAGSLFACDQDTINGTLKGRILPLSPRYNFLPITGISGIIHWYSFAMLTGR